MKKILALFAVLLSVSPLYAQTPEPNPTPAPQADLSRYPHEGFAGLAKKLLPAVVNISTTQTIKDGENAKGDGLPEDMPQFPPGSPFEDFFKDFMDKYQNQPGMPHQRKTNSLGSGFIIDSTGYIVTNNHVIQDADEINVILHDETSLKAEIIGRDPKTDIALLKVKTANPLPSVTFGDSDDMSVGDWIVVIGNPFGLGGSVTQGIISARARDINSGPYDDYIQTDASINRGNSGGPVFNLNGDVIGISTAIFSPSGGSVGIGFAIPSALARPVVEQIKQTGKVVRGWLGVRIQTMTEEIAKSLGLPEAKGALVSSAAFDGPAAKAGVQSGDVILSIDGKAVPDMRRLPRMVAETRINSSVPLTVWRDGKEVRLNVKIGELKEEEEEIASSDKNKKEDVLPSNDLLSIPELDAKFSAINSMAIRQYNLNKNSKGIVLVSLGEKSPLLDKGVRTGDVVVEAAQKEIGKPADLAKIAKEAAAQNKPILLLIDRQGDLRFVGVNTVEPAKKK